jgi:HD-like signal output (HDOD) protein
MANSVALNPSGREIADVKSAIVRVGMEAVRTVSFAVAMEQLLKSKQMQPFEDISQRLWEHTSHVAALCRVLARKLAKINGDEAMFAGLVHDLGVFYLMSRAANFPELANDKVELHALLVGWHDNIGHALLSAMGLPESVLEAVRDHETDREIVAINNLSDVLFIANKIANRTASWRDAELDGEIDTSILDTLFNAEALAEIVEESEEEVHSLKAALGG